MMGVVPDWEMQWECLECGEKGSSHRQLVKHERETGHERFR